MIRLSEISKEEFCGHMDDANFLERYGNPVMVRGMNHLVCMNVDHYDRLIWEIDRLRDLAKLRAEKLEEQDIPDGEIQYWVYELQMPAELLSWMKQMAAAEGVSLDEYMCLALMAGIRWCEGASEWEKQLLRDACKNMEDGPIMINNSYPVRKGQTETEAKKLAEGQEG